MENEDTCVRFHSLLAEFTAKKLPQFYKRSPEDQKSFDTQQKGFKKFAVKELFPQPLPVERFLEIPAPVRRKNFFESITVGNIVEGRVTDKWIDELLIRLDSVYYGPRRWINDLNIKAQCDLSEFKTHSGNRRISDSISDFDIGDHVRGAVCNVNEREWKIGISFRRGLLPDELSHIELGLIDEIQNTDWSSEDDITYLESLTKNKCFSNPESINNLTFELGIDTTRPCTFFGDHMAEVHADEYGEKLRERQSTKWSMNMVASGVRLFKESKHAEAMKCFDQALQMHPTNVEALVARGALKGNQNKLKSAIEDFYKALAVHPSHRNGQKYLCETLVSLAKQYEKDRHWKDASRRYKEVLQINPSHEEATERVHQIQLTLSQQVLVGKLGSLPAVSAAARSSDLTSVFERSSSKSLKELLKEKIHKSAKKEKKSKRKASKKKEKKKKSHKSRRSRETSTESRDTDPDATDSASEKPISNSDNEWVEKTVDAEFPRDLGKIKSTENNLSSSSLDLSSSSLDLKKRFDSSGREAMSGQFSRDSSKTSARIVAEESSRGLNCSDGPHKSYQHRDTINNEVNSASSSSNKFNRCMEPRVVSKRSDMEKASESNKDLRNSYSNCKKDAIQDESRTSSKLNSSRSSSSSHSSYLSTKSASDSANLSTLKHEQVTGAADVKVPVDMEAYKYWKDNKGMMLKADGSPDISGLISYGRFGQGRDSSDRHVNQEQDRCTSAVVSAAGHKRRFSPDEIEFISEWLIRKPKD